MTENKAEKALRKVIINLIPQERYNCPIDDKEILKIDISDKLDKNRHYCLLNIKADYGSYGGEIAYLPFADHEQFKHEVENILDATIVNAKQRESIQKLLDSAFYTSKRFEAAI